MRPEQVVVVLALWAAPVAEADTRSCSPGLSQCRQPLGRYNGCTGGDCTCQFLSTEKESKGNYCCKSGYGPGSGARLQCSQDRQCVDGTVCGTDNYCRCGPPVNGGGGQQSCFYNSQCASGQCLNGFCSVTNNQGVRFVQTPPAPTSQYFCNSGAQVRAVFDCYTPGNPQLCSDYYSTTGAYVRMACTNTLYTGPNQRIITNGFVAAASACCPTDTLGLCAGQRCGSQACDPRTGQCISSLNQNVQSCVPSTLNTCPQGLLCDSTTYRCDLPKSCTPDFYGGSGTCGTGQTCDSSTYRCRMLNSAPSCTAQSCLVYPGSRCNPATGQCEQPCSQNSYPYSDSCQSQGKICSSVTGFCETARSCVSSSSCPLGQECDFATRQCKPLSTQTCSPSLPNCPPGLTCQYDNTLYNYRCTSNGGTCSPGVPGACPPGLSCTYDSAIGNYRCSGISGSCTPGVSGQCLNGQVCNSVTRVCEAQTGIGRLDQPCRTNGLPCDSPYQCRSEPAGSPTKCLCPVGQGPDRPGSTFCVPMAALGESCAADPGATSGRQCGTKHAYCKVNSASTGSAADTGVCECSASLGYKKSGTECVHGTAKIEEACTGAEDCISAFSTCDTTTSKCACLPGFQPKDFGTAPNTVKGCEPKALTCPDGKAPIQANSAPKPCTVEMAQSVDAASNYYAYDLNKMMKPKKQMDSSKAPKKDTSKKPKKQLDTSAAPSNPLCQPLNSVISDTCLQDKEYCNYYYDDPVDPMKMKGFCCPITAKEPKCPVGDYKPESKHTAADGTVSYDCDCQDTKGEYMCYTGPRVSDQSVCCPKTCKNPSDIYKDGTCYARAMMDDVCEQDFQCQTDPPPVGTLVPGTPARPICFKPDSTKPGTCKCPSGAIFTGTACVKVTCSTQPTSDARSYPEPEKKSDGTTITCYLPPQTGYNGERQMPYGSTRPTPPPGITWDYCGTTGTVGSGLASTCRDIQLSVYGSEVGICCKSADTSIPGAYPARPRLRYDPNN